MFSALFLVALVWFMLGAVWFATLVEESPGATPKDLVRMGGTAAAWPVLVAVGVYQAFTTKGK